MQEIIEYIKAKELYQNEPSYIDVMIEKFKDKDVESIIKELSQKGVIFEPRPNVVRWLG